MAEPVSGGTGAPLRVGILLNSTSAPRWVAEILADIASSGFARLVVVVVNGSQAPPPLRGLARLSSLWRHGLYNYYQRWDYKRNRSEPDAFESVDVRPFFGEAEVITVRPRPGRFVDRFEESDVERIRSAGLDVLFRFGFRILKGPILEVARCGIWSFHHGDNREYRGAPPAFWEIYERNPRTGSILQVLSETLDGGRVLYRSRSATDFGSLHRTRNRLYWKTARFAMRCLRDLHDNGWKAAGEETGAYTRGLYRSPGFPAMVRFLARTAAGAAWERVRTLPAVSREQWFLAVRRREAGRSFEDGAGYRILAPPPGHFYADPFALKHDAKNYLFFEDFVYAEEKAVISCSEVGVDGTVGEPRTVLERPYHLSYPFLFEWEGTTFMIPETGARRAIELYRAEEFPFRWTLDTVLMTDVSAVDATLFVREDRFWLFANIGGPGYTKHEELFLFSADSPRGPWGPHPRNPIVSDVSSSRPAGALFYEGGRLIRPAQDCARVYGHAITFNEVLTLSDSEYAERPVARLGPEWAPRNQGTHSYTRTEDFEVIDGHYTLTRLKSLAEIGGALGRRLRGKPA